MVKWYDFKYILAYIGPASAYLGIYFAGIWSYTAVVVAFVLIPLGEIFLPGQSADNSNEEIVRRGTLRFFDWLLYLNVPILFGMVWYLLWKCTSYNLAIWELAGMTIGVGIYVGASGINVGHELGHRPGQLDQTLAKVLLLPALYMHFFIEHNRGHHYYVATQEDPATAKFGETIYAFWFRSTLSSYESAWNIELRRLQKLGLSGLSIQNQMLHYIFSQVLYLSTAVLFFDWLGLALLVIVAIIGFLLLESINYIEHYGLLRSKITNGHYERVGKKHSWNSNHDIGRIFLYELTRHADHHCKASKRFQLLDHIDESPQLPTGYPGSIMLAMLPPLWFSIMNRRVPQEMIPCNL